MEDVHPCAGRIGLVSLPGQIRQRDAVFANRVLDGLQEHGVCGSLSVAADQLYVAQQWSLEQFLLRDQVKRPALGGGVLPGHRELALSERLCQPVGRLDLDQPLLAAGHLH